MLSLVLVLFCVATSDSQDAMLAPAGMDPSVPASRRLSADSGLPALGSGDLFARDADSLRMSNREREVSGSPDENVCFKMRTYVVARDNHRSDTVRPIAYYTCLPGTKVAMKSAEIHLATPE